jgi:hypothetical protein
MSEGRADVDQRDSEIRQTVLACLRKRERRALFVTELAATLRKAHGVSASDVERTLVALEADWVGRHTRSLLCRSARRWHRSAHHRPR